MYYAPVCKRALCVLQCLVEDVIQDLHIVPRLALLHLRTWGGGGSHTHTHTLLHTHMQNLLTIVKIDVERWCMTSPASVRWKRLKTAICSVM